MSDRTYQKPKNEIVDNPNSYYSGLITKSKNYFTALNNIDVSNHIEKKGGFNYLSWPFAISELAKHHPSAEIDVKRFSDDLGNMVPFLKTDLGYFVEVSVKINDVIRSSLLPVLDYRNKPIAKPNTFDINTSIQRCTVKAIALHGLGLYIYAGEDLPGNTDIAEEQQKQPARKTKPSQKLIDRLMEILKSGDLFAFSQHLQKTTVDEQKTIFSNLLEPTKYKAIYREMETKAANLDKTYADMIEDCLVNNDTIGAQQYWNEIKNNEVLTSKVYKLLSTIAQSEFNSTIEV